MIALVVIVGVLAVIGTVAIPKLIEARDLSKNIRCYSNLSQVAFAFRNWENENGGFPMQVLTNKSGGPLYLDSADAFRYYQVMSNELGNPRILICPANGLRKVANNFGSDFSSKDLDYFTGLDASRANQFAFLAGDTNLSDGSSPVGDIITINSNQPIRWTYKRHLGGNIALVDGSVQQLYTDPQLNYAVGRTGLATNRLLLP